MRRVAAELDTGAASLYVYFANRDDLLRNAGPYPPPFRWSRQSQRAGASRSTTSRAGVLKAPEAYPGMASVLLGEPPTTENTLAGAENLLGISACGRDCPRRTPRGPSTS